MKMFITMILVSAAQGACADAGVNEPSIYEVPCNHAACSSSIGCINEG